MDILEEEKKHVEEEKKELERIALIVLNSFQEWPHILQEVNPSVVDLIVRRIALAVVRPKSQPLRQ